MRNILARAHAPVLEQLAWSRVLLAFDFDGTLAPIVREPDAARMRPRTAALLAALCELYPCAVISGRARDDVGARLDGAAVRHVVGNHGLEPGADLPRFEREARVVSPLLATALAGHPGVVVEDKRYSLAVHYRAARRKREARAAIAAAVRALPVAMRVVAGKLVVNVVPASAPDKGAALLRVREAVGADTALYVGDDVTDEDVFTLDQPGRLLSVRVGMTRRTAAPWYVRGQRDVDALLARLRALGKERRARG